MQISDYVTSLSNREGSVTVKFTMDEMYTLIQELDRSDIGNELIKRLREKNLY